MKTLIIGLLVMFVIQTHAQDFRFDESLVASYPFNGNANDESLFGNHGTVVDAELVADRFGNMNSAYWFNGATSFIIVPDNSSLDITNDISIAGWMKKNADVPWASMVTKGGDGEIPDLNNYTIQNSVGGSVVFTSNLPACSGNVLIPLNEWHFITFVREGTSGRLFFDGIQDETSITTIEGELLSNNSSLYIGMDIPGATEYFHGCLDDIKIFNRALTPEEITLLYNGTFTSTDQNTAGSNDSFTIWPNPVSSTSGFYVDCPGFLPEEIILLDIFGNTVFKETGIHNLCYYIDLKRIKLSTGNYFIVVRRNNSFTGKPIIIKN